MGKDPGITEVFDLPKEHTEGSKSFIVKLQTEHEAGNIIKRKLGYFKENKSDIHIHFARTKKQRIEQRNEGRQKHPNDDGCNTNSSNSKDSTYDATNDRKTESHSESAHVDANRDHVAGNGSPPFHGFTSAQGGSSVRPKKLRTIRKIAKLPSPAANN